MGLAAAKTSVKPEHHHLLNAAVEDNGEINPAPLRPLSAMQQPYLAGRLHLPDLHTTSHLYFEFDLPAIDAGRLEAACRQLARGSERLCITWTTTGAGTHTFLQNSRQRHYRHAG